MTIQTFEDYAEQARITATYAGRETPMGLAYAALGLAGEASEFLDAVADSLEGSEPWPDMQTRLIDELGDVAWYIVACADEMGDDLTDLAERAAERKSVASIGTDDSITLEYAAQRLMVHAGRFAETVKKAIGRGELNVNPGYRPMHGTLDTNAAASLVNTYTWTLDLCTLLEIEPLDMLTRNVEKLRARQVKGTLLGGDRSGETS